jgi:predicted ATPase with chaperone activity
MVENYSLIELLEQPKTIDDLNIPQNLLIDIMLRLLYNEGNVSFGRFTQVIRVPHILDSILDWMANEHLVKVLPGSSGMGRLAYIYSLTGAGEERAKAALERSQYVGPAPVPIHYYNRAIELQTTGERKVVPSQVEEALGGLILPPDFHRRIGPAVNSGSSLFLYGPSGNGKTTIAQIIADLISRTDPIWLPYALTAGGQIIQLYDRLVHKSAPQEASPLHDVDGRWGLFYRPSVIVGGELTMDALDLRFDPISKIYEGSLQLKANGGMFLIDDFGRQQVSPSNLLNRWIVPLEEGMDYLRLKTGQTIVVPFRQLIVFSTNLDPYQLADDAFYRRIQMKVEISSPSIELYKEIFLWMCEQLEIAFDQETFDHLIKNWYVDQDREFQSVHPRDLLKIIQALCEYEGNPPHLTPALIEEACSSYFVETQM